VSLTTERLSTYLGQTASTLLSDAPFKNWAFTRTSETDAGEPLIDYVFANDGIDFVCDGSDRICSIFLYADQSRLFMEGVEGLPFTATRQEVITRLGHPSKSGARINDPILGDYGPWDHFTRPGYVIHVEYRLIEDAINKLTLMRTDAVP